MLQLNRVPETRRLGSTEAVSLNHLAGIRTFIEGYGPDRIDQRGDARACLVPLAGLDAQAASQELNRGLIHYRSSCDGEPCKLDRRETLQVHPDFAGPHSSSGCDSGGDGPFLILPEAILSLDIRFGSWPCENSRQKQA